MPSNTEMLAAGNDFYSGVSSGRGSARDDLVDEFARGRLSRAVI